MGKEVILPCHIEPPITAAAAARLTAEWTRPDLRPEYVHLLQDGRENTDELNPLYKHRTFLFSDAKRHGNISLRLQQVTLADNGTYRCFVPGLSSRSVTERSSLIELIVLGKIYCSKTWMRKG